MTRINVGMLPSALNSKHLIAEHREIKRIPNMVASGKAKLTNIPEQFTLGKGHVCFFYNKLGYLKERYIELHLECLKRGYNVTNYISAWDNISPDLMGLYSPTKEDTQLIINRIKEKLTK
jgi:deoxyribonuclease (pyrimidine dimer)